MQHYTELPDIKRVIVNTHAIEPQVCAWCINKFVPSECNIIPKC